MTSRFLSSSYGGSTSTGSNESITDGSTAIVAQSLTAVGFAPSKTIKTNGAGELITVDLQIDDVTGLQTALNNTSGLTLKGTWQADLNTPELKSGVGTVGDYYVVNSAGSTMLDGFNEWAEGDHALFVSNAWIKIDNTIPIDDSFASGVSLYSSNKVEALIAGVSAGSSTLIESANTLHSVEATDTGLVMESTLFPTNGKIKVVMATPTGQVISANFDDAAGGTSDILSASEVDSRITTAVGGLSSSMATLSDVVLSTPGAGDILEYDGSTWNNVSPPNPDKAMTDLTDTTIALPSAGEVVQYDGSTWVNGILTHNEITDFDTEVDARIGLVTNPQYRTVILDNSAGFTTTLRKNGGIGVNGEDYTITFPESKPTTSDALMLMSTAGDIRYDVALNDSGATSFDILSANEVDSRISTATNLSLNSLGGVNLFAPAIDQVLSFDGANWVNTDPRFGFEPTINAVTTTIAGAGQHIFTKRIVGSIMYSVTNTGVSIIDLTFPDAPTSISNFTVNNGSYTARKFELVGQYMVLMTGGGNDTALIEIWDISDPSSATYKQTIDLNSASVFNTPVREDFLGLAVSKGYIYVSSGFQAGNANLNQTFRWKLTSNPTTPFEQVAGSIAYGGYGSQCFGDRLVIQPWVLGTSTRLSTSWRVIDISDPETTSTGSDVVFFGTDHGRLLFSSNKGLRGYVLGKYLFASGVYADGGIVRADISDWSSPVHNPVTDKFNFGNTSGFSPGAGFYGCIGFFSGRENNLPYTTSLVDLLAPDLSAASAKIVDINHNNASTKEGFAGVLGARYFYTGSGNGTTNFNIHKYSIQDNPIATVDACAINSSAVNVGSELLVKGDSTMNGGLQITGAIVSGSTITTSGQVRSESLLTNTISPELTDLVVQSNNTTNSITVNDTKAVYAGTHEFTNGLNSIGEIRAPIVRGFSGATTGLASHSGSACYCIELDDSLKLTGTAAVVFPTTTFNSGLKVNEIDNKDGTELSIACGTTPNQAELSLMTNAPTLLYPHAGQNLKLSNHDDNTSIELKNAGGIDLTGSVFLDSRPLDVRYTILNVGADTTITSATASKTMIMCGTNCNTVTLANASSFQLGTIYTFTDRDGSAPIVIDGTTNSSAGHGKISGNTTLTMTNAYQSTTMILSTDSAGFRMWYIY